MLVNSVIIVLREVLEAALMISVLLAVSRRLRLALNWLIIGIAVGIGSAFVYAHYLGPVSELFDGVGQELLDAVFHFGAFAALALILYLIARQHGGVGTRSRALPVAMTLAVALATCREGSEIIIYVSGFLTQNNFYSSVGIGSLAGAGIGFSIGVLFYYVLLALPARRALWLSLVLLGFAAAGMCAQATKLLIQADWLTIAGPLWDSSGIIAENSLAGELLYALMGYEASPSALEVSAYLGSLVVLVTAVSLGWLMHTRVRMESI
jgi:high-affinity iron transporter